MDIKLKARLSAYARVETLQPATPSTPGGVCNLVSAGPVRGEKIDSLFSNNVATEEATSNGASGTAFIDSLFSSGGKHV